MTNDPRHAKSTDPLTVSVREACALIGIGNTSFWQLIKSGRVETVSIGRRRLVVYSSLVALVSPSTQGEQ